MKTDLRPVICHDEYRVILDKPDGWAIVLIYQRNYQPEWHMTAISVGIKIIVHLKMDAIFYANSEDYCGCVFKISFMIYHLFFKLKVILMCSLAFCKVDMLQTFTKKTKNKTEWK